MYLKMLMTHFLIIEGFEYIDLSYQSLTVMRYIEKIYLNNYNYMPLPLSLALDLDVWGRVGDHSLLPCGSHLSYKNAVHIPKWC